MGWYDTQEPDQMGQPDRGSGVQEEGKKAAMPTLLILSLLLFLCPLVRVDALTTGAHVTPEPYREIASEYPAGVAWWGTWDGALSEAKRTGKPILLLSAAPHCHVVPGIW